jgi:hypothetical protein
MLPVVLLLGTIPLALSKESVSPLHPRLKPIVSRAAGANGSTPLYKNPHASIEDRVNDLLPRMTIQEKVAQMYVTRDILALDTTDLSL